jgi:hypothetical protein
MSTLPENTGVYITGEYVEKPTNTWLIDWATNQIGGMDAGLLAMRQAVEIILHNERFRWQIYSQNFGSELEALPGEDYDFLISELPRRIQDALSADRRILSAENFSMENGGAGKLMCSFDVVTVFGVLPMEVSV